MIDSAGRAIRRVLYRLATNESLFCLLAFLNAGLLGMSVLGWYVQQTAVFGNYVVVPWGMALSLERLSRKHADPEARTRRDVAALFALLAWIVVPFAIRFGLTFNNVTNWQGYVTSFFAIYVMISEEKRERRERLMDEAAALFAALSWVLGVALLYCAWNVKGYVIAEGDIAFGFSLDSGIPHLCAGVHYNTTGMIALCCMMLCIAGAARSRNPLLRLYYVLPAIMMGVVVSFTQSRTSRIAMVVALAAGIYASIVAHCGQIKPLARRLVALGAAFVVMVAAYWSTGIVTQGILDRYMREHEVIVAQPVAQEEADLLTLPGIATAVAEEEIQPVGEVRTMNDATFSDRTAIWKNLFEFWKENPKYLVIGAGVGRIGSQIVQGTIHEANGAVAVHNTYLQFVADFGLIGTALLLLFAGLIVRPVWRTVFSKETPAGYRSMFMLVVACLATGLMESAPLGSFTPMNICLSLALAFLVGEAC